MCKLLAHKTSLLIRHIGKSMAGLIGLVVTAVTCVSEAQLSLDVDIWCISSICGPTDITSVSYIVLLWMCLSRHYQ